MTEELRRPAGCICGTIPKSLASTTWLVALTTTMFLAVLESIACWLRPCLADINAYSPPFVAAGFSPLLQWPLVL
eukprot:1153790-Pelagomonas_calceolata.AAC.2